MAKFVTPINALIYLGLYDPDKGTQPNTHYLKLLFDKKLLKRIKINNRVFRYDKHNLREIKLKILSGAVQVSIDNIVVSDIRIIKRKNIETE